MEHLNESVTHGRWMPHISSNQHTEQPRDQAQPVPRPECPWQVGACVLSSVSSAWEEEEEDVTGAILLLLCHLR